MKNRNSKKKKSKIQTWYNPEKSEQTSTWDLKNSTEIYHNIF